MENVLELLMGSVDTVMRVKQPWPSRFGAVTLSEQNKLCSHFCSLEGPQRPSQLEENTLRPRTHCRYQYAWTHGWVHAHTQTNEWGREWGGFKLTRTSFKNNSLNWKEETQLMNLANTEHWWTLKQVNKWFLPWCRSQGKEQKHS